MPEPVIPAQHMPLPYYQPTTIALDVVLLSLIAVNIAKDNDKMANDLMKSDADEKCIKPI